MRTDPVDSSLWLVSCVKRRRMYSKAIAAHFSRGPTLRRTAAATSSTPGIEAASSAAL